MKNIGHKSISELEGWKWKGEIPTYENDSSVVCTYYELHNKPLSQLNSADVGFLIGQEACLQYLIPIALNMLKENILSETSYPGGLLVYLFESNYWKVHPKEKQELIELYNNQTNLFESIAENPFITRLIKRAYKKFLAE